MERRSSKTTQRAPSHIFDDRNLKKLKKVLDRNNLNECKWIIKNDSSRDEFMRYFS